MKILQGKSKRKFTIKTLKKDFAHWQRCGFGHKSFLRVVGDYYGVSAKLIRGFIK